MRKVDAQHIAIACYKNQYEVMGAMILVDITVLDQQLGLKPLIPGDGLEGSDDTI